MNIMIRPPIGDRMDMPEAFRIFFVGSIDNGNAEEWQDKLFKDLVECPTGLVPINKERDIICFNPRREDWKQLDQDNLEKQIKWELNFIDHADLVVVYFADTSYAPITFLELGTLLANRKNVIIYCSEEFYRYDNVRVTAEHYDRTICTTYEDFLYEVNQRVINTLLD